MPNFVIGKGTQVRVALLPLGDRTTPGDVTLTTAGTETAKDTTSPGVITLAAALGANILIPAGTYLTFKAPTTGKEVTVQLVEDAVTDDSELAVNLIPEGIAASSIAKAPLILRGRTSANLNRSGKTTTSVDFDSAGYADGALTSIEQKIDIPGAWLPTDAGFATVEYAFQELREIYLWLELPKISAAYSKGKIYHGPALIENVGLESKADGIIDGKISVMFAGKPTIVNDTPV